MSGRIRTPTSKGAEYTATLQAKKQRALARISAKKSSAKSESDINELAELFGRVSIAKNDAEVDNLTDMLAKMGGRKRKTHKRKVGKKSRKTRKH